MPIYEYQCVQCGNRLEKLQKLSDAPLTECPACGEVKLKKLVSAAGFQLKGDGWYVTDFRDKKPKESKSEQTGDSKSNKETQNKETPKKEAPTKQEAS